MGIEVVHDLPGVGRNLQDHHSVGVAFKAKDGVGFDSQLRFDRMALAAIQWRLTGTGPIAGLPVAAQGFYRSRPGLAAPDVQFLISPVSMLAKVWFPGWRKGAGHVFSFANVLLRPASTGEVTLRSADPADKPKILYNLLKEESDRDAFRRMVRFIRRFFATEPAASLVAGERMPGPDVQTDAEIDAYVRGMIGTAMHPTSTCAMGTGPMAVLDNACRVRGIEGLRVVDASSFPAIVGGNTNAPVIMLAERASDLILGNAPLPAATV